MNTPRSALAIDVRRVHHDAHDVTVLRMTGAIASDTATTAREALNPVLERTRDDVVVDLEGVESLDSTGLMLLTDAFARLSKEQRRLVLSAAPEPILRLLRITGLLKVFTVRPSLDESISAAVTG